jgi:hypothetical protein
LPSAGRCSSKRSASWERRWSRVTSNWSSHVWPSVYAATVAMMPKWPMRHRCRAGIDLRLRPSTGRL